MTKRKGIGLVKSISGPVVTAETDFSVRMFEVARVGSLKLMGEVVRIRGTEADIQTCEDTTGLRVGEEVIFTDELLGVDLGPGLLGEVFDGMGRPLREVGKKGIYIGRGWHSSPLDSGKQWHFVPSVRVGDVIGPGDVLGTVLEGSCFPHRISVPPGRTEGLVAWIAPEGDYSVENCACRLESGTEIGFKHRWDVRVPRPIKGRLPLTRPLLTGQRVLDTLFPIALGGAAVLPGGFGTGKTVIQQSLARWCNADVIVYIGCGERGNEMTEVIEEFPELVDPRNGVPLMERMILIANTSNMPVAAREASIYLGITLAEYYRDMGYDVAVMADSTSRWAEALREIGGRLEEMPGEEGYPAYLGTRLSCYYERAGRIETQGTPPRQGSVTMVNAISPGGGDFSEPVTQASLRLSGAFWGLDKKLAQARHFPAINWHQSYSLYDNALVEAFTVEAGSDWQELKNYLRNIMLRERELSELAQLTGRDGLSEEDRWVLYQAENLKIVYLQQNAYSARDVFSSLKRSAGLLRILKKLDDRVREALKAGLYCDEITSEPIRPTLFVLRELSETELPPQGEEWLESFDLKLRDREKI